MDIRKNNFSRRRRPLSRQSRIPGRDGLTKSHFVIDVVLVCGFANSGKSTFIAQRFPDAYDVIDIMEFQKYDSYPENMPHKLKISMSHHLHARYAARTLCDVAKNMMRNQWRETGRDEVHETIVIEGVFSYGHLRATLAWELLRSAKHYPQVEVRLSAIKLSSSRERKGVHGDFDAFDFNEGWGEPQEITPSNETISEDVSSLVSSRNHRDRLAEWGIFDLPPRRLSQSESE